MYIYIQACNIKVGHASASEGEQGGLWDGLDRERIRGKCCNYIIITKLQK